MCGGINTINTVVKRQTDVTVHLKSKQLPLLVFAGKDASTFNALINIDYCRGIHIKNQNQTCQSEIITATLYMYTSHRSPTILIVKIQIFVLRRPITNDGHIGPTSLKSVRTAVVQRQTAVTAYLKSKQLLLFAFARN